MAHGTWKHGIWLGLVGFALASGCVVKSTDDDDDITGGSAGEDTGGSSGKGGSSGSSGKGGSSGSSATGGTGATTGGTAGATGGTAGATGGTGGSAGGDPECDPDTGELDNTPSADCEPRLANDSCELCMQANCCDEVKTCFGYAPGNVCGYGGPTTGTYAGQSEIDCYISCALDYVDDNGAYDDGVTDECVPACVTDHQGAMCGLIGSATQDLVVCIETSCEDECFTP